MSQIGAQDSSRAKTLDSFCLLLLELSTHRRAAVCPTAVPGAGSRARARRCPVGRRGPGRRGRERSRSCAAVPVGVAHTWVVRRARAPRVRCWVPRCGGMWLHAIRPRGAADAARMSARKTRNWQGLPAESYTRNSTAAVSEAGVRFHVISSIVCGAPPASAAPMLKVLAPDGARIVFAASSLERT